MKSAYVMWFILSTMLSGATAYSQKSNSGQSKIKFETSRHRFGNVTRGKTLSHVFAFKNVGTGPLSIHGVHASCGCTAVEVDRSKLYRPGEVGQVEVRFDTSDFSGKVSKAITVMTNERILPDRTLTVSAFVKSEFDASPPLANFGTLRAGEVAEKTIQLKPLNDFALKIVGVDFNSEILDVTHSKNGDGFEIRVVTKKLSPGFIKDNFFIQTNSSHMGRLKIPVRIDVKGAVEVSPSYLEFGAIAAGAKSRRSLVLKGEDKMKIIAKRTELILNGAPLADADSLVEISSMKHEKEKKLVAIELKNAGKMVGNVHGKLFLQTNVENDEEMTVDFYAFFR